MICPEFVAEVSSNHHQDLARSLEFVDKAAQIGCSAIKFQLFKIEELFAPEILVKSPKHRDRKLWELPVSFIPMIADQCRQKKIKFSCTPFYLKAVAELFPYLDFYKISSYELLWNDLLISCAKTGKPVVLSTGMATMEEIRQAVSVLLRADCVDLTLLHCVSGYPAPVPECNLAAIETMRRAIVSEFGDHGLTIKFGWSDHSRQPAVIYRAIHTWRSRMIEFHLDLDGTGEEFPPGHCWLPDQIKVVIDQVKDGLASDGSGLKEPSLIELPDRQWRRDPYDGLRPLRDFRWK